MNPGKIFPGGSTLRRHPDRADQARPRGGHVGVATQVAAGERAVDGMVPSRTLRPETTEDLAAVITEAELVRARRSCSGAAGRASASAIRRRVTTSRWTSPASPGIVEHSPADLVCTVRAGTTLAELARALSASGQRWPVEAPLPERATVGGTIASAAAGPSRLRYQHPRDWIIGCTAVLGDGTITHAGGRVVKNVTGYDMTRLYSGSYGTLVALAEVTLKLIALPERTATLRATVADLRDALRIAAALRATHLPLDALAMVTGGAAERVGDARASVFIRVAGAGVPRSSASRARCMSTPARRRSTSVSGTTSRRSPRTRTMSRAPDGRLATTCRSASTSRTRSSIPGVGSPSCSGSDVEALRADAREPRGADGALIVERADAEFKRAVGGAWGRPRIPLAIASRAEGPLRPARRPRARPRPVSLESVTLAPLQEVEPGLRQCIHCGMCLEACPTYQITRLETESPRGRIHLMINMLEGGPTSDATRLHLDRCLACRACEVGLPVGRAVRPPHRSGAHGHRRGVAPAPRLARGATAAPRARRAR